jgi:putative PIN family toxin of toxin-antitoxin system
VPRAVVDPGVLIAAFLSPRGAPAALLRQWIEGLFDLIVSRTLLAELERVLLRPKFRAYATEAEARIFIAVLARRAVMVADPTDVERVTPDPGDDFLVALARAARASVLVSGDRHLTRLTIDPPVITPRAFLDELERS